MSNIMLEIQGMWKLIYIPLLICSNIVCATEVLIAGEHTLVTPANLKGSGVCFSVESIDQELFIDLYAPVMHASRKFSHIWVGGHEQYSVEVAPKKSGSKYKIQISGSPEQLRKVNATLTYLNSGKDVATLNIEFHAFFTAKNTFTNSNRCKQDND